MASSCGPLPPNQTPNAFKECKTVSGAIWYSRHTEIDEYLEIPTIVKETELNKEKHKYRLNTLAKELAVIATLSV